MPEYFSFCRISYIVVLLNGRPRLESPLSFKSSIISLTKTSFAYCEYVNNLTQEDFAFEIGYTPVHVSRMNKELILFLQKKLEGCERDGNGRSYDQEKEEP